MTNVTITQGRHPFTGRLEPYAGTGLSSYKLSAGHGTTQQFSMVAVSPRPDSETGSYAGTVIARHRWAYYDGANPVRYEVPVKIFGGSAPHIFELLRAPTGATIGNNLTAADHGVVKWTPSQSYPTSAPAVFTVRVYGQDINYIEITWTVATSSSTSQFIFVDNTTGNDTTGTGAISAPFATLGKVTGTTTTTTTYPSRLVYLRGSATNYVSVPHSNATNEGNAGETIKSRCEISSTYHPNTYMSFPDESVKIDVSASLFKIKSPDFLFSGSSGGQLTIIGSATNAAETHNFWLTNVSRMAIQWVTFDGFIPRTAQNWTNSAPIFAPACVPTDRQYCYIHSVTEINRAIAVGNDALLHSFFGTNYFVSEYCSASRTTHHADLSDGNGSSGGCGFKDRNFYTSVRYADFRVSDPYEFGFSFMDQTAGGNNEIVFSRVKGKLFFNSQATPPSMIGKHYAGRCTVYTTDSNYQEALKAWAGDGPYLSENCVLVSNGPLLVASFITSTGNECHKTNSSGDIPINTTTLNLVNATTAFRTLYLGIRGAEIQ